MDAFNALNAVDCSGHVEKKNGMSYLPWAWAWAELKKRYPDSYYTIYEGEGGRLYHTDGRTCWVKTGVTLVDGEKKLEHIEYMPVMDMRNRSIPADAVTSTDANKAVQRSLTKACARHGLGLYVYAGEDLPEDAQGESDPPAAKVPAAAWSAKTEINIFCQQHYMSMDAFAKCRTAVIARGIVPSIPAHELTKEQCKALLEAIRVNCCEGGA